MPYLLNVLYLLVAILISPWLLYKALTTGKYRRGMREKFFGLAPIRQGTTPCVWFHGVSVGEIHLLRQAVKEFRKQYPQYEVVISTTTNTGFDEAKKIFPDLTVFYWPLDFTWAIRRTLRRIRPALVVLAESELWPNFLHLVRRFGAKIAVINGRMSPRSARRFAKFSWFTRRYLNSIHLWLMQTDDYAENLRTIGVRPETIQVTRSIKYDGPEINRHNPRAEAFRELFAIEKSDLVWVVGSTQTPEEEIALTILQNLHPRFPNLRLILVPRQKERFDEVANLVSRSPFPLVRRSQLHAPITDISAVVLVDTIGELSAVWGLADVAFVGGSLDGQRGGQNMIEPAAYGAAVVFGPHVWNFQDTVNRLLSLRAAVQITTADELEEQVARLLADAELRQTLGTAAHRFVLSQQGATARTIQCLHALLSSSNSLSKVA